MRIIALFLLLPSLALGQTAVQVSGAKKGSTPAGNATTTAGNANRQSLDVTVRDAQGNDLDMFKTGDTVTVGTDHGTAILGSDGTAYRFVKTSAAGEVQIGVVAADTVQSACSLGALNATCQVSMVGKSSAGFVTTAVSSPSGITLVTESSRDGTNWDAHPFGDASTGDCISSIPNASLAVGLGKSFILGAGDRYARVRVSAYTSGSVTVTVTATDTVGPVCTGGVDRAWYTSGVVTATALTQAIAAPASGVSVYITGVVMSSSVASTTTADQQLRLKFGTGTNCANGTGTIVECFTPANGGCSMNFNPPIKVTAANAVCYMHAATGSKSFNINYFIQ